MNVYLDASAIVPLFVSEARSETITGFIRQSVDKPIVSALALGELASALSRLIRRRPRS